MRRSRHYYNSSGAKNDRILRTRSRGAEEPSLLECDRTTRHGATRREGLHVPIAFTKQEETQLMIVARGAKRLSSGCSQPHRHEPCFRRFINPEEHESPDAY